MGCFHPRDAQALLSLIRHHHSFASFSAPSGHFVQRIVFYLSFQVQLVVCYVSLNCSLSVCQEGNENGRLATFDDTTDVKTTNGNTQCSGLYVHAHTWIHPSSDVHNTVIKCHSQLDEYQRCLCSLAWGGVFTHSRASGHSVHRESRKTVWLNLTQNQQIISKQQYP